MCAAETPPWIESTHACSFGRMPPPTSGSASSTSSARAWPMIVVGSLGSRSQPSTSVRKTTLYALIERAIAPAASSALTL